ncbi:hypothetical protein PRK78_000131 [Emydomyces testavorans]|uniref:Ubiquitin-like domain-containing protein n=1 Tax=Emydomyces testavorans TaxID=2070801 RepID=A0AAF0DAK7_9EURO|nr:hypothetical protein PRK78_000131 [Emydomyces testavorans]
MATNTASEAGSTDGPSNTPDVDGLSLQILSPSFQTAARISLKNISPTTTVSGLKTIIAASLATQAPPETQRLIYRGKELSNTQEPLTKILELGSGETHSIHLVLPPGTPLLETSAFRTSLKQDQAHGNTVRASVQRSSAQRSQRIQDLLNPASTPPERAFDARTETAVNKPPSPTLHISSKPMHSGSQEQDERQAGHDTPNHGDAAFDTIDATRPPRFSQTSPLVPGSSRSILTDPPVTTSGFPHAALQGLHVNYSVGGATSSSMDISNTNRQRSSRGPVHRTLSNTVNPTTRPASTVYTTEAFQRESARLSILSQRILTMEEQIHHGIVPTIDEIARIRFQLFQMVDEQHRNPLKPREPALEGWIARVSSVATRADQIRVMKARQQQSSNQQSSSERVALDSAPSTASYLLTAPNGNQYMLMRQPDLHAPSILPPRTPRPTPNIPALVVGSNAAPVGPPGLVTRVPANRVFRQPLVRRRYRRYVRPINLVAVVRSIWLFIRLYFFSYLFSAGGSWLRTILVVTSAIIAIFSETEFPRRAQRFIFSPVQRHLENLLILDGQRAPEPRAVQAPDDENIPSANTRDEPVNRGQDQTVPAQTDQGIIREGLRSLERSVAIFLASFVPGLSERHIAARNAAEAARRTEEQERQQEENQHREEDVDGREPHVANDGIDRLDTEDGSGIGATSAGEPNAGETQQRQPVNQEGRD